MRRIAPHGALDLERAPSGPTASGAACALSVRDLHKSFLVSRERRTSIKEVVAHGRAPAGERVQALDGATFDVAAGEFVGVVGRNGSGKSTLLRIVAGIYVPDAGEVVARGRVSPFIETGVGFRPDLSANDNIVLNGAILGVSRAEMRRRIPEVLDFADLEGFGEHKLKNFSKGMAVRLAFASALQADADILLLDEVLAVGDEAFQAKCHGEFERLKREGRTVLLVTHDMDAVERFCHRAVLLDAGRVIADAPPTEVAEAYHEINRAPARHRPRPERAAAPPRGEARRTRPSLLGDERGQLPRLALAFARADVKIHYQDSVLGYLWSVLRPLGLFAVLLLVFSRAAGLGDGVEHYPIYLLTAVVLWTFFAETTSGGVVALTSAQHVLRRMRLPSLALPLAVVLKAAFNLVLNLLAVAVFVVAYGVEPRLGWLELPLLAGFLALFGGGLALVLSALYVRFRDVHQAWTVVLQFLFFASPIVFVASRYPAGLQEVLDLSPLAVVFTEMRHALIDPSAPSAAEAAGGAAMLAVPVAIVAATIAAGLWLFRREAPRIAERL